MPPENPPFDLAAAHRFFAPDCFNRTWELIEKPDRTAADNEAMLLGAMASLWHWTQRADCTDQNRSIGHWQVSRVYALLSQGENAMRHAQRSLELVGDAGPFFVGYSHEAIARAALLLGDAVTAESHLGAARQFLTQIPGEKDRAFLEKDLSELSARKG